MTIEEATKLLKMSDQAIWLKGLEKEQNEAIEMAIKSLEAWEKIDDDIASLQDIYSFGGADTEKAIWENLHAVRKTIHKYLSEVSE